MFSREKLYKDIDAIFGSVMRVIEQNKDGIIFADEDGTQYQIKVTQKKTKSEPSKDANYVPIVSTKTWSELVEMIDSERLEYEQLKEEIRNAKNG